MVTRCLCYYIVSFIGCLSFSERLEEFVESEAELSGSDFGSGDEEEEEKLAREEEEYEEDEGSDVPHSDNELWNQVNKAHMSVGHACGVVSV